MLLLAAVGATLPPQVVAAFGVSATARPAGSETESAAAVNTCAFGLPSVTVSDELGPACTGFTPNASAIVGVFRTFSTADAAVWFEYPSVELAAPIGMLLVYAPGAAA